MSTETLLKDFDRVSKDLARALEADCKLKETDYLRLENYLLVITTGISPLEKEKCVIA